MNAACFSPGQFPHDFFAATVDSIRACQHPSGAIAWFQGGKTDPWDHIEAAMGLTVAGDFTRARAAYQWLIDTQLDDGSWWAEYDPQLQAVCDRRETNFVAYIATGLWHYYLASNDRDFLIEALPTLKRAMAFVIGLQSKYGDIAWAVDVDGTARDDALVTGCSSIYKSLDCAVAIAQALQQPSTEWQQAQALLRQALREKPERFDRTWESKARYSMDWFYPVLAGLYSSAEARARLAAKWQTFVRPGLGCLCVSDEPWVTVAESCELVMALLHAGQRQAALDLYQCLHQFRHADGSYWTGYVYRDEALWPEERTTWTAGAVLLAADALTGHSGASHLFTTSSASQQAQGVDLGQLDELT